MQQRAADARKELENNSVDFYFHTFTYIYRHTRRWRVLLSGDTAGEAATYELIKY